MEGYRYRDGRSTTLAVRFQGDVAAHSTHEVPRDGQAETDPGAWFVGLGIEVMEALEHERLATSGHPDPVSRTVTNARRRTYPPSLPDGSPDIRELDGVSNDVEEHLPEAPASAETGGMSWIAEDSESPRARAAGVVSPLTSVITEATSTAAAVNVRSPASIREMSTKSSSRSMTRSPARWISRLTSCRSAAAVTCPSACSFAKPSSDVRGGRSSCDTIARNSVFSRLVCSSRRFASAVLCWRPVGRRGCLRNRTRRSSRYQC